MMARTLVYKALGRTDVARWAHYEFPDAWAPRSRVIAQFIPRGSRVVEFGAGRCFLEQFLPPDCVYMPTDIVVRRPGMRLIDLNQSPLPDLSDLRPTVAVLAGVFEYLNDIPRVAHWLAKYFEVCIASYEAATSVPGTTDRICERKHRVGMGWINDYSESEFVAVLERAGWRLVTKTSFPDDPPGVVFAFEKSDRRSARGKPDLSAGAVDRAGG
jgi:hypothetical protein